MVKGIVTGDWSTLKNIAIAAATAFVFSGIQAAAVACAVTGFLETPPGQDVVKWQANEIYDDMFGMRPRAAYFWSYLVTDAALTAAVSYGIEKVANPSNAKVVKPGNLTEEQYAEYRNIESDKVAMNTKIDGRSVAEMSAKSRRALLVDGHVKAIIANQPVFGIPFLPFEHTAIAVPGGGDFSTGVNYLWNKGVCHQARMRALRSAGVTGLTPLDLSWQFSNWLSYGVYGTYGQQGATIDNVARAIHKTQEKY